MTFRDSFAICTKCGNQFVFRVEDQRQQAKSGDEITPPELCPNCQPVHARDRAEPRPRPPARPAADRAPIGPGPHEGIVKWYDGDKGYGFVVHPGGEEIFFHRTGIAEGEIRDFAEGTRVTFLVEQTQKGLQAIDVGRMEVEGEAANEGGD